MSDEKEGTGQCGWLALAFFIVLLQGLLPLSVLGGMKGAGMYDVLFGHAVTFDLISRLLILIFIVAGFLLSAVCAMIFAIVISNIISKLFKRGKKFIPGTDAPLPGENV